MLLDRSYRVPPPSAVRLAVGRAGDDPPPCEVDDLTIDGARITVPGAPALHLVVGRPETS